MGRLAVVLLIVALNVISFAVSAQKQLIVLKREKVLLRLYPGDEINYSIKGDKKKVVRSYINNLFDTALLAHRTVVPFHKIERIYFKRGTFSNLIGGMFVTGGVAYFLIDQFNVIVVQKEDPSIDERVSIASAALVGAGLPLMLIKKKYRTIGGKHRIMMVDKGSVFYVPDTRQLVDEF